jgi:hypothetical protein
VTRRRSAYATTRSLWSSVSLTPNWWGFVSFFLFAIVKVLGFIENFSNYLSGARVSYADKKIFARSDTYRQICAYIKHGKTNGEGRMPTRKEAPTHFIGIKLTESQLRDLMEYVERTESTTSQTVRRFIRQGLERDAVA